MGFYFARGAKCEHAKKGLSDLILLTEHVAEEVDHPMTVAIFVVVPAEGRKGGGFKAIPPTTPKSPPTIL